MARANDRDPGETRLVTFEPDIAPHAQGSVLIGFGNTRVICSAMIEDGVPRWMKEQNVTGGWITAEYSMLPYSTITRKAREIARGKADGRGTEIQRLIGRSLRAVIDLQKIGPRTIWVDCDVVQADGGTRTASITGAAVAMEMACRRLMALGKIKENPIKQKVAAVSVGVIHGEVLVDLDYLEDKDASVDMNLVMTDKLEFVEVQGSGEEATFSEAEFSAMIAAGKSAIASLIEGQEEAVALWSLGANSEV